ncbi:unnamed protein product, partial [Mesorhabditis belari]|uniref:rhomboid protease n=1 Tax=Mesorhabditis belari TaxID=2138241 RepID=A0AAF3EAD1_9BILA
MQRHQSIYPQLRSEHDGPQGISCELFVERLSSRREELALTATQIRHLAREADKNRDGYITDAEFGKLCIDHEAQASVMKKALYTVADVVITPKQRIEVHSYLNAFNCCPPPLFIVSVSILQVIIFLYYYYTTAHPHHKIYDYCAGCYVGNQLGPLMFVPKLREQVWRFVTYMFLHAGLLHLIGNLVMQLLVGIPLEVVHKIWRIGPLYLMAVIAGALLQYPLDPSVLLVGASAGVYALILAHLANVFINWAEMPFRWLRLLVIAVWLCFDIGGTVYRRFWENPCDKVSHAAHIAGGVTGFCFGVFILYNMVERTWERVVKWCCLGLYLLFLGVCIFFTIFRKPTDAPIWNNDCFATQ